MQGGVITVVSRTCTNMDRQCSTERTTVPRIYDNLSDSTKLGTGLNEFLHSFDSIDVATGYFDLRGWSQLDDLVRTRPF